MRLESGVYYCRACWLLPLSYKLQECWLDASWKTCNGVLSRLKIKMLSWKNSCENAIPMSRDRSPDIILNECFKWLRWRAFVIFFILCLSCHLNASLKMHSCSSFALSALEVSKAKVDRDKLQIRTWPVSEPYRPGLSGSRAQDCGAKWQLELCLIQ